LPVDGPTAGARETIAALAAAALETASSRLGTAAERNALATLLEARRRRDEGDVRGAAERVFALAGDRRLRASPFWKRYGAEIERLLERARRAEERAAKLSPYGATSRTFEPARRQVSLRFDFRADGAVDGALLPKGALRDAAGLRWPGSATEPGVVPEQCAPLRIPAPPEAADAESSIRCALKFDPRRPPSFVAASWFDATFLAFGSLRDFGAFAGVPLHGLERDLLRAKDVDRGLCWFGGVAEARRRLAVEGAALPDWTSRGAIVLGFDSRPGGEPVARFGDGRFPVRGVRPRPAGYAGLELRLPPGVVLESVELAFPVSAPEDG
jgi:hypothetical protein